MVRHENEAKRSKGKKKNNYERKEAKQFNPTYIRLQYTKDVINV